MTRLILMLFALVARPVSAQVRLESLNPTNPAAYFEAAESIMRTGEGPDSVSEARRLLVLALQLDRALPDPTGAGASACVALADLASTDSERRWLLSIASQIDPRYRTSGAGVGPADGSGVSQEAALEAAQVLGLVRAGRGPAARRLMADPVVMKLLERFESQLAGPSASGALRSIRTEAEIWPDDLCRGEGVVRVAEGENDPDALEGYELCPRCGGDGAPFISHDRLERELSTEWLLLKASSDSWAAQIAAGGGEPLRDPDPDSVAAAYGIDASLTVYRDGRWVRPEP